MKQSLLLLLFSFCWLSSLSGQQSPWQWVNPLPQGNILNGIWTFSQDSAIGVAENGTVVRTTNRGQTWQVQHNVAGTLSQLYAVHFMSQQSGIAVGELGTIVKTNDGGASWLPELISTYRDFYSLEFASSTVGWAAGAEGTIFKTTNAGTSWIAESSHTTSTIYTLYFQSLTNGWAAGANGTILHTTNGGITWTSVPSGTTQNFYSIQFPTASTGYVVGSYGTILKSTNSGATWIPLFSGTELSLYSLQFVSSLIGYAVGSYGIILKTTDGGISWQEQGSPTYNDLFAVRFVSPTLGWAMGDFGTIVYTSDGGFTWVEQSTGLKNILNGISFATPQLGWTVGEEGTIAHTSDGGLTWVNAPSSAYLTLWGVHFINQSQGWIVGDSAVVLRTTNSGYSWSDLRSHTDISLYSIFFANQSSGWTVGDFGTILGTTNGGTTWTSQTSNTPATLTKIKFASPTIGWAVGYGGTILKTTNGGLSWQGQPTGIAQTLYSLDIIDANTVSVVGDFGTVLTTTNGGTSWISRPTNSISGLYGVAFVDRNQGWAVGDDGTILNTADGGSTWTLQASGTENQLWDVKFIPSGIGGGILFAAGTGGTILCSTLSPLPLRMWNGSFDSLWTSPGNWTPIGVPDKLDSVYIPQKTLQPVISTTLQQINVGSLAIGQGARLSIKRGLAQLVVKGSLQISGTLSVDTSSTMEIYCGGNFQTSPDAKFFPGKSTIVCNGVGRIRGNFYNLTLDEASAMMSTGNLVVANIMIALGNLDLRSTDTLTLSNPHSQALLGPGIISAGTIKRAILPGSNEQYRFESSATTMEFYPGGTTPDTISITTFPYTLPPGLRDSLFVRRSYMINMTGGNNYLTYLSMRYDTAESRISVDNLALFRDSSGVIYNLGKEDYLDSDFVALILDSVRTLPSFSTWYLGAMDYYPSNPMSFFDTLVVSNVLARDSIVFGALPGAAEGIDGELGEYMYGPRPGASIFDVRWILPTTQEAGIDIRDIVTQAHLQNTYTCTIQAGSGGYPVTLQWQPSLIPAGKMTLQDQATHGASFQIDMKKQGSFAITNPSITAIEIVHNAPTYFPFNQGWNMVSLPFFPSAPLRKTSAFPQSISYAFGYSGSYFVVDTLRPGIGYWIKLGSSQSVGFDGDKFFRDTVQLVRGWNMIGGLSVPLAVSSIQQIPPGIVTSNYFGFKSSYTFVDSLRPAQAYWVKANSPGKLVLASGIIIPKSVSDETGRAIQSLNMLLVTDHAGRAQTLYFGRVDSSVDIQERFELPPRPPADGFDARLANGALVQPLDGNASQVRLDFQSDSYPVTIAWHLRDTQMKSLMATEPVSGATLQQRTDAPEGTIRISNPSVHSIIFHTQSSSFHRPERFTLYQNYPNPFNPSTEIRFDLPVEASVTIRIYNILGQLVSTITEHQSYPAGAHRVKFQASEYGSGVYFYRIIAQGAKLTYDDIRKMILMK